MIITRTPFRISFFGGGTDYPAWYLDNGGAVLSTTINKYCYLSCRVFPPFFKNKNRIVWSQIENINNLDEIQHPSAREVLRFMDFDHGVSVHHDSDLPARAGLGSSSCFTVGLLHALHALKGKMLSKMELAKTAIHIEQNILKENVGSQDQIAASFGGFNKIEFNSHHNFSVHPVSIPRKRIQDLNNHLMLFFTGISRNASEIAAEQIKTLGEKKRELETMRTMVDQAITIINSQSDLNEFGKLLHEAWNIKRSLTNKISTPAIDTIYETAIQKGATGGKLLGAGGGGFILFFVKPENQPDVRSTLKNLLEVPFEFENNGSQVIFYNP